MINRSNNIYEEIQKMRAIHGTAGYYYFLNNKNFNRVPTISKDIHVIMISDSVNNNEFSTEYVKHPEKITFKSIKLNDQFRCFIDKIEPLLNFIKTIKEKYVMYLDTRDAFLVSDIKDPEHILNTYKCKVLFNAEDGYSFPDHPAVPKNHLKKYAETHNCDMHSFYKNKDVYDKKNQNRLSKQINCDQYRKSLNAGLFLGEREFLIEVLSKILDIMNGDPTKGFPHGEQEDQKVWQYMMSEYENNEIEIDFYNLFFLWIHDRKFNFPVEHWEHFNFFNNNFPKQL